MLDLAIKLTGQNANLHLADNNGPQRVWNMWIYLSKMCIELKINVSEFKTENEELYSYNCGKKAYTVFDVISALLQ